jgi:2-oxoglutarate ferredoxin oxidoreductase subunit alpha
MTEKRAKKLEIADSEIPAERRVVYYGTDEADVLLVGWGYVKMVAVEALKELDDSGYTGAYLHLKTFSPFPSRYVASIMDRFPPDRVIAVEYNYQAQAAMAVKLYSGKEITRSIVKYTGRPMYLNEVVGAVKTILETDVRRVVLSRAS